MADGYLTGQHSFRPSLNLKSGIRTKFSVGLMLLNMIKFLLGYRNEENANSSKEL